jgi:hypothetical protein
VATCGDTQRLGVGAVKSSQQEGSACSDLGQVIAHTVQEKIGGGTSLATDGRPLLLYFLATNCQ